MKILRPHQTTALNTMNSSDRGIINYPTGTGKTLIMSRYIANTVNNNNKQSVCVILSPRIIASGQLLLEVRQDLIENKIDCQYLVINSDLSANYDGDGELRESRNRMGIDHRDLPITTSSKTIKETYEKAQRENVPLVISSTYHSADRIISSEVPIDVILYDEGHHLVTEQFYNFATDNFKSKKKFFFTATMRNTSSDDGLGMNNPIYGGVIAQSLPVEMVEAGEIVRPRIHYVDMSDQPKGNEGDGLAVVEAFNKHNKLTKLGAKLLVVTKDTEHLSAIIKHQKVEELLNERPNLKIFDISTEYGSRINGNVVKREQFLAELKDLKDDDEAIIVHIDILTESVDAPITGILPMSAQTQGKFSQTLGRATRLNSDDRGKLYSGEIKPCEVEKMIKPYAYVIIPTYGEFGNDLKEHMKEMVVSIRSYWFKPVEDVVISGKRGKKVEVIEMVTEPDSIDRRVDFTANVLHEIEKEEVALESRRELHEIKSMETEKLIQVALNY